MSDHVTNGDGGGGIRLIRNHQKIEIISAGFIAICSVAGNVQSSYFRFSGRQEVLLDFLGQYQGVAQSHPISQAGGHGVHLF